MRGMYWKRKEDNPEESVDIKRERKMLINKSMRLYSANRVTSDQERVCRWRFIAVTLEGEWEKVFDSQRSATFIALKKGNKSVRAGAKRIVHREKSKMWFALTRSYKYTENKGYTTRLILDGICYIWYSTKNIDLCKSNKLFGLASHPVFSQLSVTSCGPTFSEGLLIDLCRLWRQSTRGLSEGRNIWLENV